MREANDAGPWSIPSTWAWRTMTDVADVVGGGTPRTTTPAYFEGGDIPWITPADLSGYTQQHIARGARNITRAGLENSGARVMPPGAVLFSSRAPIGYVAIASTCVCTNQGFKSFVPTASVASEYLYYYLLRAKPLALEAASGTTFLELSGKNAARLPIPLPPLAEQRRIVEALETHFTRLDAAVATLERVRANLRRYRASVLQAAVEGRLTGGRTNWRQVTVGEAGDVLLGRQRAPQYLTGRSGRPYLRVANVKDDRLELDDLNTMDFDPVHFEKYRLEPGDVLVSEGQSLERVGQSAIYRGGVEGLCFQKTLHRFRAHRDQCLPEFAQLVFRSHVRTGVFQQYASITTNISHLVLNRFKQVPFPLPPLDVQEKIVAVVAAILTDADKANADVTAAERRIAALRSSLLRLAFSGRLVPQDPRDEPADVLLARIRAERDAGTAPDRATSRQRRAPRPRGRMRSS